MFLIIILLKLITIKVLIELKILNIHTINGHQIEKIKKILLKKKYSTQYQVEKRKILKI